MNVALPALVILLGLLPGIVFYFCYFAGRFEKRRSTVSAIEEFGFYVVCSIPLDALAFWICRLVGLRFDFNTAIHLLGGTLTDAAVPQIAAQLERQILTTTVVYVLILVFSGLGGFGLRNVVWRWRIDTKISVTRLRHPWFYLLQGRMTKLPQEVMAWVDILAKHPEDKSRLYRGLVADFDMAPDGKLESITLRGAKRGSKRGAEFTWREVPSHFLVIMGCEIHSINVTYYEIADSKGDEPPSRINPAP